MKKFRLAVLILFFISHNNIYSQNDTILFENFTFGGSTLYDGWQYYGNDWDNEVDIFNDWGSGVIWQGPFNVQQPFNNLGWVNVSYGLPGVFGGLAGNQGFYGDVMFASPKYLYDDIFNIDYPQTLNEWNNHYVRTILVGPSFDPSQYDIVTLEFATGHFPGASVNSFSDTCIIAIRDGFETQVIDFYINETISGVQTYDITEYINPESNNHQLLFQYSGVHPSGSGWAIDEIIVTGIQIGATWDCNDDYACVELTDGSGNFQSLEECEANCSSVEPTWDCNNDYACVELTDGSGNFQSLEECEANCSSVEPTWDCNNDYACVELSDGSGEYGSLNDCEANCTIVIEDSWNCLNDACVDPMDGSGVYSSLNDCEQVCQNISSVNENNLNINIYPNPSSNIFNLEFNADSESKISVTNILGEQVYFESTKSIGEFNAQIDLSDYSKGIYNLTIKTSDGISNHKLILK